jgi:hypothetical protein
MPDDRALYRPGALSIEVERARKQLQKIEEQVSQVLRQPVPDTFLGRKTHEPFPKEDPMEREDIPKLMQGELQPPK